MSHSLVSLAIALADDELIIGHRHSEWTGFAPHLEEDVAFSSIAQDEIGHAAAYYSLAASLVDDDPDRMALGRSPSEYRNATLCERPNREWAYTLARHWLYDNADDIRLEALSESRHDGLRHLVSKIRREERYHLLHADAWIARVARGPVEGRKRLIEALSDAYREALGLFEPLADEVVSLEQGWMATPSRDSRARFVERTAGALDELGLPTEIHEQLDEEAEFVASSSGELIASANPDHPGRPPNVGMGGRLGRHSEDFMDLWTEMTSTYRGDPGATW